MQEKEEFKFSEFFMKYKKYLSAAVLVLALIIILICCIYQNGDGSTEQESGITLTEVNMPEGKLAKDADSELVSLMKNYYKASADAAIEELEMLAQPLSDNQKSYIQAFSDLYEEYRNIVCYSAKGAAEDSYFAFVCYDLKLKDVETLAPGMDFFYVERDGKGNLYINNVYSAYNFNFMEEPLDQNLYSQILDYEQSEEVVALQKDVQQRYEQAVASDENLANAGAKIRQIMSEWKKSIEGDETSTATEDTQNSQPEETQKPEDTQTEENTEKDETDKKDKKTKVKTTDICRVRKGPSTDAEILGTVDKGVTLTKLGTEGDWTKVKFQGKTGYIKSEFLKEVKSKKKSDKKDDSSSSAKVKTLDICRVRKGPGTDTEILGTVDVGVELEKLGTEGDWTKVKFQGKTGYIKTEFLKAV